MITLKSTREIELMDESGEILADVHRHLRDLIKPGIDMWEIEKFARGFIESHGAKAAQIGFEGYEYATCCSLNNEICHGFPRHQKLKSGDLIKVDMCVDFNGAISDSCWAYAVGEVSAEVQRLMAVTKKSLYLGIEAAKVGNRIGDIGHAIQTYVEGEGFSVVRDFVGHGIGPTIHEEPMIPHYGEAGRGLRLKEGMVITIEPMVNIGDWQMVMDYKEMSGEIAPAYTKDGSISCQYEHSLVITKDGPRILTEQD
ncbi:MULTISPECIES: type I methionyl aminopeptidase [unclassified Enterococcus]|uniref:type I methionyl aminopeptidase n=1 Tax=unclassified Enterococcus TaxID=2608891 RepID=UPI001556F8A9|nr:MULTISPECIES: type I methionyl aminopeptidase [unclassified Enterococcus]MBS7576183.1 type I methionyl aminopeptidase [Enterococcus sp. MMGLQ5-2]MBS7583416.1 type I methionyl aminopeptidase [Enterococcus sp. MMGLQ5-1]NPD11276.1 type I methionyl aminopeptidase [Enterococcus sp. MMGLQ5-1]NPD36019.1 type I methionyl aminopeptidase [Enterococcus sp. MMGLQ5-2]